MSGRSGARKLFAALLVAACVWAYDPFRMENTSGDTISARYWPVAILKHGTWKLNPFSKELGGIRYAAIFRGDEWYPRHAWGMALFTVPFYAAADALDLGGKDWTHDRINAVSRWNAIFLSTASVLLLFFLLARFTDLRAAFASSALFAFGTWNFSLGAQGLSSQTVAVFCHMLNLHLLWKLTEAKDAATPRRALALAVAAGVLHGVIWGVRPQDALLVAPAFLLFWRRGLVLPYVLSGLVTTAPLLLVYREVYGEYLGAYGVVENLQGFTSWRWNGAFGFAGLLFSPNRGAIVFFPLFLAVPWLWWRYLGSIALTKTPRGAPKSRKLPVPREFAECLGQGALVYFVALCFLAYWHSTWSFGPRYLYDIQPYVWPAIALAVHAALGGRTPGRGAGQGRTALPRAAVALLALAALQGVVVHFLGHRNYDLYVWNFAHQPVDEEKAWLASEWMMSQVWEAGSNDLRWQAGALHRLRNYGF